jgi:hypothetical protein
MDSIKVEQYKNDPNSFFIYLGAARAKEIAFQHTESPDLKLLDIVFEVFLDDHRPAELLIRLETPMTEVKTLLNRLVQAIDHPKPHPWIEDKFYRAVTGKTFLDQRNEELLGRSMTTQNSSNIPPLPPKVEGEIEGRPPEVEEVRPGVYRKKEEAPAPEPPPPPWVGTTPDVSPTPYTAFLKAIPGEKWPEIKIIHNSEIPFLLQEAQDRQSIAESYKKISAIWAEAGLNFALIVLLHEPADLERHTELKVWKELALEELKEQNSPYLSAFSTPEK